MITFPDDYIIMPCDQATWHRSKTLIVPNNIQIFHIPPATPEMNPIEQIWKQLRQMGFKNEIFQTLEKVVDRLCVTIRSLTKEMVKSITGRKWIIDVFS